jgi:formylglycine-generating enzyme required for sulfatase activity
MEQKSHGHCLSRTKTGFEKWLGGLAAMLMAALLMAEHCRAQSTSLAIRRVSGKAELTLRGCSGTTNQMQFSSDLRSATNWTTFTNVVLTTNQSCVVTDQTSSGASGRFYRVKVTGGPPTNPNPSELVWIPAGTFLMGSPSNELDRSSNEGPQTQVTLTRGFWMAKTPVTQSQYLNTMGVNPSFFKTGSPYQPVESVSWTDATNYCAKLTQAERAAGRLPTNYVYRLPTEAEREYATRAGTTNRFSYGDDPSYASLASYAWYGDTSLMASPKIVGQKLPNPWGLYDLHGNVMEWCWDWSTAYAGGQATDPKGPGTGTKRVIRGGSVSSLAKDCRSAFRIKDSPANASINVGFRVVLAPPLP